MCTNCFAFGLCSIDNLRPDGKKDIKSSWYRYIESRNIWTADGPGAEYTGELTATMVKDFGVNYTPVGHSERRYKVAAETNVNCLAKTKCCTCCWYESYFLYWRSIDERKAGETLNVCKNHLSMLVDTLSKDAWD